MTKPIDITGQKFNKLTAIIYSHPRKDRHSIWIFKCDCGKITQKSSSEVKRGIIKSCGCFQKETRGKSSIKHNQCRNKNYSGAYRSWLALKNRCNKDKNYIGISFSDEWKGFVNFYRDMGDRPKGSSIDRIDSSKGYFKDNCKWSTSFEQSINTSKKVRKGKSPTSMFKGVCFSNYHNKYRARIGLNYKRINIGFFDTELEAAKAYNEAAKKYFGEFAQLNDV